MKSRTPVVLWFMHHRQSLLDSRIYLFLQTGGGGALCLSSCKGTAGLSECNAVRHYNSKLRPKVQKLNQFSAKRKCDALRWEARGSTASLLEESSKNNSSALRAIRRLSHSLATESKRIKETHFRQGIRLPNVSTTRQLYGIK
jgi:hypothetical protein